MSIIEDILGRYLALYPEEQDAFTVLRTQLADGEDVTSRKNFTGHVTSSGLVVSADHRRVLLIHHRFFVKWLQPGGPMEPGEIDPYETALREVREETGIQDVQPIDIPGQASHLPVYIDSNYIRARPERNEPEHWHHDFRYAFLAGSEQVNHRIEEVYAAEWMPLDDPRVEAQPWIKQGLSRLLAV